MRFIKYSFIIPLLLFMSQKSFSQEIKENAVVEQITEQKLTKIPTAQDDAATEKLLKEVSKRAGWFPDVRISVYHGIVSFEGKAKDKAQLKWLSQTADKLPTVIAVVNKAQILEPPVTDMTPFFNELNKIITLVKKNLPRIIVGIILSCFFIFVGLKIYKLVSHLWSKKVSNAFLSSTVARLSMIPVWVMLFYLTLLTLGLQSLATTIIGGTGVLGIIFGFAFKGIAENYLSGILLAIRSPFGKGDNVKIDDVEGIVQNLNMRGTTLMDFDGHLVLIPNSTVIQSVIRNRTVSPQKRSSFVIGVGYGDSIKRCQELILDVLRTLPGILQDPAPLIAVEALGTSTVNIKVFFFFNAKESSELELKSAAMVKAKDALLAEGISLPDEAREVVFADTLKIRMLNDQVETHEAHEGEKSKNRSIAAKNLEESHQLTVGAGDTHEEFMKGSGKSLLEERDQGDLIKPH